MMRVAPITVCVVVAMLAVACGDADLSPDTEFGPDTELSPDPDPGSDAHLGPEVVSNEDITQTGPQSGNPGHEVFEPDGTVWLTFDFTPEEFDAVELPEGWTRNQSRGGVATDDSPGPQGRFLRSPGREEGEYTHREMFGANWQHMTNIVGFQGFLDDQNLLIAAVVQKYHELTWFAGSTITLLTSPEGVHYALNSRDARRTQETPTIPDDWVVWTLRLEEDLLVELPFDTTVVRTDNQDSFQGPLADHIELPIGPTVISNEDITKTRFSGNPAHEVFEPDGTVWITLDLTPEAYDALELPEGWNRNQSRGGVATDDSPGPSGRFLRSPGRENEGEFTHRDMFGALWQHVATIVGFQGFLDDQNLLVASTVQKYHEYTWHAGSTITVLTSPEGVHYALNSRDARRTSDTPTIPGSWLLRTFPLEEDLLVRLPFNTTVVRTDNQDSFQGPLADHIEF